MKSFLQRMSRGRALALLVTGALLLAMGAWGYGSRTVGATCVDGWESESGNPGRCSSHGGVAEDIEVDTVVGQPAAGFGITRWPAIALGGTGLAAGLAGAISLALPRLGSRVVPRRQMRGAGPPPVPTDLFAGAHLDLRVAIAPTGSGYSVALTSPAGETPRVVREEALPVDRGLAQLTSAVREAGSGFGRFGSREERAVEQFGTRLFRSIFVDATDDTYRRSIDFVRDNNAMLRIVLEVDEAYADIPWEYLFDPDRGSFLARSYETSVVRLVRTAQSTRRQTPISTLRVLSMATSPRNAGAIDVDVEQAGIRRALAASITAGRVQLEFVDGGSFAALRAALDDFHPHVFHFAGHGDWDQDRDDGVLQFEDGNGFAEAITGRALGAILNRPEMRLAVFNSCHAATPSKADRFAGITAGIVAQGVPAAIGMQFAFDDRAAVEFGQTLLREIGAASSLDRAITEARMAVFASSGAIDWGTPVLTSRVDIDDILPRTEHT